MSGVEPFAWRDKPALIERLLPAQKLSAEVYKERMAGSGQTLTALGSYWKGRKPLILAKACVLGCLLPATGDDAKDLEVFELLMGMDPESFVARSKTNVKPAQIVSRVDLGRIEDYFLVTPRGALPVSGPVDLSEPAYRGVKVAWRPDVSLEERRRIEARLLPNVPYRQWVEASQRPEEVADVHDHIWGRVNAHLGTDAHSFPELVEQLGVLRFGKRPLVADTFCGSGQIPFEAARLGCDVYASDLNPIACMLTWGAFHIVGASPEERERLRAEQEALVARVQAEIDALGVEEDGAGWRAKVFLYCVEAQCPQTGWRVPLLPSLVVSKGYRVVARLVPVPAEKRYDVEIVSGASEAEMKAAERGTVRTDGRGQDPYLLHTVDGEEHRTTISTLRGDYRRPDGSTGNRLRPWELSDIKPRPDDLFQERLYCVQWMRPRDGGKRMEYEFRSVTEADLERERRVEAYLEERLEEWTEKGWIPDMRIEPGAKTDEPIRTRGWTHWRHLFNPRQLLVFGLMRKESHGFHAGIAIAIARMLDWNSRLCTWRGPAGADANAHVFVNQALNPVWDPPSRSWSSCQSLWPKYGWVNLGVERFVETTPAESLEADHPIDVAVTDPPYGDAVNYEEILEFFIAWLRKNPPPEFADWTWDSRRALAIKGSGHDFKRGMIAAYRRMTECMAENGLQVIMFTHQSGAIWADMASIVWASGLQVTAAWYVVTETDSALREGSYVKGTVLLVCRKRQGSARTSRTDLAFELQEEVRTQVERLTGLNQHVREQRRRDENVFEDADLQMAGYAAALRVLTHYATIDGRDMPAEAERPRVKGEKTFVDDLIEFAVGTANSLLVPHGLPRATWEKLTGAERFYLKMLEAEARGLHKLDDYQNFAKAFKVRDFGPLMATRQANKARLKSAAELGKNEMGETAELGGTVLRGVLYALWELGRDVPTEDVLAHLKLNVANWIGDGAVRERAVAIADYLAAKLEPLREREASDARVLREAIRNQRLGG